MSWVATAIGGSAVLGFLGSQSAADAQAGAARDASRMTMEQYKQTRDDLMPWQTTGKSANMRLADLLGIATPEMRDTSLVMPTREQFTTAAPAAAPTNYTSYGPPSGPVSGIFNGFKPATPGGATFDQTGYDKALAEYNSKKAASSQNPADYGSLLHNFTGADLASEPGYEFGLSEGEKGINRMAMAGSGRNSGATMKALLRFNQDYAGTKYNDAFSRDAANKSRTYGFLTGVSGQGENAAAQTGGLGANAAGTAGNFLTSGADASAAGTVGGINALTSGVGSYLGYQQNQSMLDYLKGLRSGTAGAGGSAAFAGRM